MLERSLAALTTLLLAGLGIVLTGTPALACDGNPLRPAQAVDQADVVFAGAATKRVVGSTTIVYTLSVDTVFKGDLTRAATVELRTPRTSGACGLTRIPADEPWVFFATKHQGELRADSLSGTATASNALVATVRDLTDTAAPSPSPTPDPLAYQSTGAPSPQPLSRLLAPGAAAVLLGLMGWLAARRLGRR